MPILYDQFNRPIKKTKAPLRRPLAAAPLSDAWRDYVADGLTPERLAAILKQADAGDLQQQAELFEQIEEKDGHIIGEVSKRKNVILDADFAITPATDDARDVKIAEDADRMIAGITDWPEILVALQDAVGKGFSAFELIWDTSEGMAAVNEFKPLPQKRFLFTDKSGILSPIPRLLTDTDPLGMEIPEWKTIMHRYGGKSGSSTRSGIYRICAWWYLFKNYSIKDWVIFCEVYGMPLRLGKYDPGASDDDKEALEIAVQTLGSDAAGIISRATEIEFKTGSSGTASTDLYENLAKFANREMSKAILGSTLTAESDGKGSYALGSVHNDVRIDLINADCRAIASTVRTQLIRPWVGFNYGWDAAIPKYTGRYKKDDLKTDAEIIDRFADRMDIPASHVRKKFSIPAPQKDDEILRAKTNSAPVAAAKAGNEGVYIAGSLKQPEKGRIDVTDLISGRLEKESDVFIADLLEPVKKIMAEAGSIQEMRNSLMDVFPAMDISDLGALIAKAMTTGNLAGRYAARK